MALQRGLFGFELSVKYDALYFKGSPVQGECVDFIKEGYPCCEPLK